MLGRGLPCSPLWRALSTTALPPAVATHRITTPTPAASPDFAPAADGRLFAVVSLGCTQFKVTPGDVLEVEKIKGAEVGSTLVLDDVLLVGSRTTTVVGRPAVPGAAVHVAVEEQTKGKKVLVFKKKRRKGYKKMQGYRRQMTVLRVMDVVPGEDFLGAAPVATLEVQE